MKKLLLALFILSMISLTGCKPEGDTVTLTTQTQGRGVIHRDGSGSFPRGTLVDLEAVPDAGWRFLRWEGPVTEPFLSETTILMDRRKSVRAFFVPNSEPAITSAPGGFITWTERRTQGEADIEYIMLHAISDAAKNPRNPYNIMRIRDIFESYRVEAHYVIEREGTIYQFVPDDHIARHAGIGSWNNDPKLTNAMNRYAIGIELLGIGTRVEMKDVIGNLANMQIKTADRGYTEEQYLALEHLLQYLTERYGIPRENIITHKDYDPGRKWDPGELFDWN